MVPTSEDEDRGAFVLQNWRQAAAGEDLRGTAEFDLYTDARVLGQLDPDGCGEHCPYQVLNVVGAPATEGAAARAMVLRVDDYGGFYFEPEWNLPFNETDESVYHGGRLADEVAALLALSLGMRVQAGGVSRVFRPDLDPKGQPDAPVGEDIVPLPMKSRWILPRLNGEKPIGGASLIRVIPQLAPEDSVALVRAARLYQQGVWMAESSPEMAWLLLVSAVETAADHHYTAEEDPVSLLEDRKKKFAKELRSLGGDEAVELVANQFAMVMQGTKKFIDFCLEFIPEEPDLRPPAESDARIRWSRTGFRENLSTIYGYRSRALHAGTPFPAPMCSRPLGSGHWDDGVYAETQFGGASATLGGVWQREDVPMLLHTYEYIARNVLVSWGESLGRSAEDDAK